MVPGRRRLGTPGELRLQRIDVHSVRNDDDGQPVDKVAQDYSTANSTPGPTEILPADQVAVSDPELPLPDVPLIVEALLMQARQFADKGAAIEVVEEILDQVAALRDGLDS